MNSAIKIVVALIVVALIAVIGLIVIANQNASEPAAPAATTMQTTAAPEVKTELEKQPEESEEPDVTAQDSETSESNEAQDEAQGTMYEGALAGLSEEEIAKMALAEEQSHGSDETDEADGETGAKDAGD